jgi:hypothetical protein
MFCTYEIVLSSVEYIPIKGLCMHNVVRFCKNMYLFNYITLLHVFKYLNTVCAVFISNHGLIFKFHFTVIVWICPSPMLYKQICCTNDSLSKDFTCLCEIYFLSF